MRGMMGGGGQMGKFAKADAQKVEPAKDRKTFADVAGCDNAKLELMEIVQFLKNPESPSASRWASEEGRAARR